MSEHVTITFDPATLAVDEIVAPELDSLPDTVLNALIDLALARLATVSQAGSAI